MTRALVMMKAMPPTNGHQSLIDFAKYFADEVTVLIDTASNEPFINERVGALRAMAAFSRVDHITIEPQCEADSPDYWDQWENALKPYHGYDYVIGSENYCFKIAEMIGARYIPFDPNRELRWTKGTTVRNHPRTFFKLIAPEFQPVLRRTITVFGAESTGKTTLSKELAKWLESDWLFEWARPYLETVGPEINVQSMTDIWKGQYAAEALAEQNADSPFIIRDTDLYSTIGYWEQPHWQDALGPVPSGLIRGAEVNKADLYIITKSNIPFEEDPLRYGGDKRESPDEYWVAVAEKYNLNYVVLDTSDRSGRLSQAVKLSLDLFEANAAPLRFDRRDT